MTFIISYEPIICQNFQGDSEVYGGPKQTSKMERFTKIYLTAGRH